MILTNCAACAAPLAHDAPRCIRWAPSGPNYSLFVDADRPSDSLWDRSGVGWSPTPHARPLPSVDIYGNSLGQTSHLPMIPQSFRPRALWRAPSAAACGLRDHPTPDLSQRESGSRSASEKSVQFGPDGAPSPSKTSITRGPPGIVIAVSSDPILPNR